MRHRLRRDPDRSFRLAKPAAATSAARRGSAHRASPGSKGGFGAARFRGRNVHLAIGRIDQPTSDRPGFPARRCAPRAESRDHPIGDYVRDGVIRAWGCNLRSIHGAGICNAQRCRASLRAADRFRICRRFSCATQPLASGFGPGRNHATGAQRIGWSGPLGRWMRRICSRSHFHSNCILGILRDIRLRR